MQLSPWKEVQSALNLPELRVIKPSNTHWLSHERCIKSIRKELPAIILTLQELYESKKHLEFSPFCHFEGVPTAIVSSEILNLVANVQLFYAEKSD